MPENPEPKSFIHPAAHSAFDSRGESLIPQFESVPDAILRPRPEADAFVPEIPVAHTLTTEQIQDFRIRIGNSRVLQVGNGGVALFDSAHVAFTELARDIQRQRNVASRVHLETVEDELWNWCAKRYQGLAGDPLSKYLEGRFPALIQMREMLVPLWEPYIQGEMKLGPVRLVELSGLTIANWRSSTLDGVTDPNAATSLDEFFLRAHGHAAVVTAIEADIEMAEVVALKNAETAAIVLRLFDPFSFGPGRVSSVIPFGQENRAEEIFFRVEQGKVKSWSYGQQTPRPYEWRIGTVEKERLRVEGRLEQVATLMFAEQKSELQMKIADAITLFGKGALRSEAADRLVYILPAIESLLLRSNTEPIQANGAERLAAITAFHPEERRDVMKRFRNIYGHRSEFLHHGKTPEISDDELFLFLIDVQTMLLNAVATTEVLETKQEFLDHIDRARTTYPPLPFPTK